VPTVNFGISSTLAGDASAYAAFSSLNATVAQQGAAATLYATLAGRIASITRNARLSEENNRYTLQGDLISRAQQTEFGVYAQDTWRFRPNITLTGGLRWEVQKPFIPLNDTYSRANGGYAGLFGESGVNNLFRPGTLAGTPTSYVLFPKQTTAYDAKYNSFAPSVGFTYSPNFKTGLLRTLAGESGKTVIRGGFSMAYVREGMNTFQNIFASNPGGTISATQNTTGTPFALTFGNLFRNGVPAGPAIPASPVYPNTGAITDGINDFKPNIKIGYVESWTVGIQREINADSVFEVRYVGNRGHQLWRQYDLNEVNVFENGFLNEFRLAQANVLANLAAGRGFNFRYFGAGTGTFPLPILLGHFSGLPVNNPANAANPANYGSTLFANTTLLGFLNPLNPNPGIGTGYGGFSGILAGTANEGTFAANKVAAGIPYNFWVVNPGKRGGSFLIDNNGQTWYDAITLEYRRRLAKGLLVQSSYTFGKAMGNWYQSASNVFDQPATLRDFHLRKNVAPFDITQSFKTNFIYELPVGRGKALLGGASGWLDKIVGGWGFNGNVRIQSGSPFNFGNVQLVGMTAKELQKELGIYRDAADADGVNRGNVFIFPADIRINTYRANNTTFTSAGAVYTQGAPTGRFIAPAGFGNCVQGYVGQCGYHNLVLKGPAFFRFDLSIAKKIRFSESVNFEARAEFLNAFNNINWLVGAAANDVNGLGGLGAATFGRYTAAYQDTSTTNDPGGRLVQLVLRLNF